MSASSVRVARAAVDGQQTHDGKPFPLALQCERPSDLAPVTEWIADRRNELIEASSQHGAILFRGFPVRTAEDFDAFVAAFDLPNFPYYDSLSDAVRVNRTPRVFTAHEAPPS